MSFNIPLLFLVLYCVLVAQLCLTLCDPMECSPWLCPWDSPGKSTGVGSHCLLQGIFPAQGPYPGLPHCRHILYWLNLASDTIFEPSSLEMNSAPLLLPPLCWVLESVCSQEASIIWREMLKYECLHDQEAKSSDKE